MKVKPWEEYPKIWKTEFAFMSFLRGGIRRSLWNKNPIKLEFLKESRRRIVNPVEKNRARFPEVWGGTCYACKNEFPLKDMEVDHLTGNHSLRTIADIQPFVEGIVCISKKDLGLICKPCHKAKSYAEKQGISFEDAVAEKEAIAICKTKKDKEWLEARGIAAGRTAAIRRQQIVQALKEAK